MNGTILFLVQTHPLDTKRNCLQPNGCELNKHPGRLRSSWLSLEFLLLPPLIVEFGMSGTIPRHWCRDNDRM